MSGTHSFLPEKEVSLMGNLSDAMQNLVDDIRSSAEIRQVKISEMKSDTHNLLERFHLEHQDMANTLREKLSSDNAARRESTRQFMSDVRSEVEADREATQDLLKGFHSEHQDMADDLREKLSSDDATRREAAHQFMRDVRSEVETDREATQDLLKRLHSEHEDMADALKEKLSSDEAARSEAVQQFMRDVKSAVEADKEATQSLLKRFHSEHQDMADALREELSSDDATRREVAQRFINDVRSAVEADREATQQFMSDVRAEIGQIESDTHDRLDEFASDRRRAREIWRGNFVDMVEEPARRPVAEEEKLVFSSEDQILEVVARHPEGIRLVDIGNELGVDWRSLIGSVKPLVDEDRVEKIDNLYYPKT